MVEQIVNVKFFDIESWVPVGDDGSLNRCIGATGTEYGTMDAELNPVVAALADLSDDELGRVSTATCGVPQTAPGLLA